MPNKIDVDCTTDLGVGSAVRHRDFANMFCLNKEDDSRVKYYSATVGTSIRAKRVEEVFLNFVFSWFYLVCFFDFEITKMHYCAHKQKLV